jgi:vacuolar-type H+-ATPase subunit H
MRIGWGLAEKLANWIGIGNDETEEMADTVDQELIDAWKGGYDAMRNARDVAQDLTEEFNNVEDALAELKGEVDERQAWRNLQDDIQKVKEAAVQAFTEATPEALRNSEAALDNARLKVGEYIAEIDTIPEDQKTEFIANLDRANIDEIEAMLAYLARAREIPFMPVLAPGAGGINEVGSGGRPIGEAPISLGRGNRMATGGVTVNVAGSVIAENDLVETVRKGLVNAQRNGAGLVYTNR